VLQERRFEDEGETPALSLRNYDVLKNWVFEKLESKELIQAFDTDNNRVVLKKQSADLGAR
jgi:hypothetical protein